MNILAIMASPRRQGNTELLFAEFIKGAKAAGAEVDEIYLSNKNIKPCMECYGCEKDGHCIIKDDFNTIYDKLEKCDALLIAMPIFFYAMPAQLKALIDRCQAFFVRKYYLKNPIIPDKKPKRPAYLIAVGAVKAKNLFEATEAILKYFYDCIDMEQKEKILVRGVDKKGDILKYPEILQNAFDLGRLAGIDNDSNVTPLG